MAELMRFSSVYAGYGESIVLDDVSVEIAEHGSLAILGRNGVGKTTLLRTLMGLTAIRRGSVTWRGTDLSGTPVGDRARLGIGWVPQERGMWPSLTVEEHLTAVARPGEWTVQRVYQMLPRLRERRANFGNQLSGGEQQMLAIGRALVLNPQLLLLDEPMEGLAPIIVQDLTRVIHDLVTKTGIALIIVEQHARLALSLAREAVVLDRGRIVHRGDSAALLANDDLLQRLVSIT